MALFDETALVKPGKAKPWERLKKEKADEYEVFKTFLSLQDRSLQEVADRHSLSVAYCSDLAKQHSWLARSNAYDYAEVEEVATPELIRSKDVTLQEAAEDHLALCQAAQRTAAAGFGIMQKYIQEYELAREAGDSLPSRPYLKTEELVKMAEFGIKYERLIMGEATSRSESKTIDYSALSDSELKLLQDLLEKTEKE